jgi:hypothetical protein
MKLDLRAMLQSIIVALLLALLGTAVQTWLEVKMLRHDMTRVETILDALSDEVTKK